MFDFMISVIISFFDIFCCKIFCEIFGKIRHKGVINAVQVFVLSGCLYVAAIFLEHFVLRQVVNVIIFSVFIYWHAKISVKKSVILAVLYEALLLALDYIAYTINSRFFYNIVPSQEYYPMENYLIVLLGRTIVFLCIIVIRKQFSKNSTEMLIDTEWLRFLFFPVFTIVITSALLSVFQYVTTKRQASILFIIAFGIAGMNLMVFYLINDILKRETRYYQDKVFLLHVKNQLELYRSMSEYLERQKRKTHEYKNQMMCIETLADKKQYAKLESFVKEICGNLQAETEVVDTNNVIVNAIINIKYQEAASKEIVFVLRINDLSELRIKDEDIVIILANLLNNAIEACEKCANEKIIKLKFVIEDGMITIAVKNTFNHIMRYENGEIKTTKLWESEDHGMGIKNIIKAVEKYDGTYMINDKDQEFYFLIMIPA